MLPQHILAPRILFYAVNGLGLGHVTRLMAIASAVRDLRPQTQFLFITTSEADNVIFAQGFASVKLPSRSAISRTGLRPRVFNKLTHTVVSNTIAAFNPAVLVVDTFPAGASQELLPTLNWEMRRAFVFRAQQAERMSDPFFQSALSSYDLCIVPHKEGSEDLPIPATVKQSWTGEIFIRSRDNALSRNEARTKLGLPTEGKILYVSFGGGGGEELTNALSVTLAAAERLEWTIAVADAPLSALSALRRSPAEVFSVRHYPMAECFNAFDAAVTAGGYNTVAELMHFGVPTIVIPFPRGLDDQYARAEKLVAVGAALRGSLDVDSLSRLLKSLTTGGQAAQLSKNALAHIPTNGAPIAAEAILGLL